MNNSSVAGPSPLIAIVNDDPTQRNILMGILQQNGFQTLDFSGAEEALAAMRQSAPPDLILTDLYMPGIDGWRFCRLLRSPEYKAFNRVPILVVSATFSGEEAAQVTADTGADAFVIMPPDVPHLLATVHKLLRGETEGYRPRVIIVEDSKPLASILRHTFNNHGYQALIALSAREAIETFRQTDFDVALLDYYLTDGHGDALLETFRAIKPDCVCIMMTTDPDPGLALQWMKSGASAYLHKPFDPDYLIEVCARARRELALLRVERILERRTQELRKSEALLASTQSLSKIGGFEFDVKSQSMRWTLETYRIHDLAPEDLPPGSPEHIDRSLACYSPSDRMVVMDAFTRCIKKGESYDLELPFTSASGRKLWARTAAHAIFEGDRVITVVGNIMDVTERKQAEEEQARLEKMVNQAQRMESIGRLAGGMAHDLNNLLMPILGYGEILQAEFGGDDEKKQFADEIVKAALRSRDLVRQLLAYSRRQILEFKPVDLNRLIGNFEYILKRKVEKSIIFYMDLAPELSPISGDGMQLEQVIMNLVLNAKDAMPEGGELTIKTAEETLGQEQATAFNIMPARYVTLSVSDTGTGMDEKTASHVFEPFFTTKAQSQGHGTGLGLATAYGIVKQHGGHIGVKSEPGKGTTFICHFPISVEKALAFEDTGKKTAAKNGETILLVEDNEQVRDLAKAILERRRYKVLAASNADHALSVISDHKDPVHLLLTDMLMPGMNGWELYTEIAKKAPDIKVIFMSGYTDDVFKISGLPEKELDFLQKPFPLESLEKKVRDVLDGKGKKA